MTFGGVLDRDLNYQPTNAMASDPKTLVVVLPETIGLWSCAWKALPVDLVDAIHDWRDIGFAAETDEEIRVINLCGAHHAVFAMSFTIRSDAPQLILSFSTC